MANFLQGDLFSGEQNVPDPDNYPHNITRDQKVAKVIEKEFANSKSVLVVTGFISLEFLASFFDKNIRNGIPRVRLIFGFEPNHGAKKIAHSSKLNNEIKEHWLKSGYSILSAGSIIQFIDLINNGIIDVRFLNGLHGKIFAFDDAIIVGSSNFSSNGLNFLSEANVKIGKGNDDYHPKYREIKNLAEYYWDKGLPYNEQILDFLKGLVEICSWKDALARGIHELLEGEWVKHLEGFGSRLQLEKLWPIQLQGIGKALSILEAQDSILIADPTGSGKTRMIATLHCIYYFQRYLKEGKDHLFSVVLAPPSVIQNWARQYDVFEFNDYKLVSHGALSLSGESRSVGSSISFIEKSDLLVVDEAHNFLNPKSQRSLALLRANCDNAILATATPMNRRAEDLLRLIEILDPDNLNDKERKEYFDLRKASNRKGGRVDINRLRHFIKKFTLRRTKSEINTLIDKDATAYLNVLGMPCRYPEVKNEVYSLDEGQDDRELATQIRELSRRLIGVANLASIKAPKFYKANSEREHQYLKLRQNMAPALARYNVWSLLRSSRLAAIEHILGTDQAFGVLGIAANIGIKRVESGNMIKRIDFLKEKLPNHNLKIQMPEILVDIQKWRMACEEEMHVYSELAKLIGRISSNREQKKARKLVEIVSQGGLCLAFDTSIITLYYLRTLIKESVDDLQVRIVTGGDKSSKEIALRTFGIESKEDRVVGLCSDVMSEGVNLQKASSVVFLDLPSVIRTAEQRIGRVNRLDSVHDKVKVYWPKDSPEFALRKDERLAHNIELNGRLLGNNIELPSELAKTDDAVVDVDSLINENTRIENEANVDDMSSAFNSVENLVGSSGLLSRHEYDQLDGISTLVKCHIGVVTSREEFVFSVIRGGKKRAARWILYRPNLDGEMKLETNLDEICLFLRSNLPISIRSDWDEKSRSLLAKMKTHIRQNEQLLLSNRKQRALKVLKSIVEHYLNKNIGFETPVARENAKDFLLNLDPLGSIDSDDVYDLNRIASNFLGNLQQVRLDMVENREKQIHLEAIKKYLKTRPQLFPKLEDIQRGVDYLEAPDRRIAACIVGC